MKDFPALSRHPELVSGSRKLGFTLIELLVVVLIIGILAAVALPQYKLAVQKTQFTAMIPWVENMVRQQEIYLMENGSYANSFEEMPDLVPPGYVYWNAKQWVINTSSSPNKTLMLAQNAIAAEPFGSGVCQYYRTYAAQGNKRYCRSLGGYCDRLCLSLGGVNKGGIPWTVYELP